MTVRESMVPLYHRPHRLLLRHTESSSPPPPRPPPANESSGSGGRGSTSSYSGEADFDANMVIILAALLCALICALGLNSIVRCALRCSRRFTFETPDETAARLAATGLKKSVVSKIPVVIYGAAGLFGNNNNDNGIRVTATDCAICLGEFVGGERLRVLPKCKHGFHVRCIDTWLASHSSCPTCRQSLVDVMLHDPHQDDHQPQPPAPSSNAAAEADDTLSGIIRHHYYQDNYGTTATSSSESQNQTIDVPMPAADEVG